MTIRSGVFLLGEGDPFCGGEGSFFAAADAEIEADYAVLVAGADYGKISFHIVLALNDLLRALGNVGE